MLKHSRELLLAHQQRHGRWRIYAPRIKWSKWLYTGDAEDEALPKPARQPDRKGKAEDVNKNEESANAPANDNTQGHKQNETDIERNAISGIPVSHTAKRLVTTPNIPASKDTSPVYKNTSGVLRFRGNIADALEWAQTSEDVLYALKLSVALFLVLWPAFIASWNTWFSLNRGCE